MNNGVLVSLMGILCLITFVGTLLTVVYVYEDRIVGLEYEVEFLKFDLSCDSSPNDNMFDNNIYPFKESKFRDGINKWYLENCV